MSSSDGTDGGHCPDSTTRPFALATGAAMSAESGVEPPDSPLPKVWVTR